MENYKTRKETCEILGIHFSTLYKLAEKEEIESIKIGERQLYNVNKYLKKIKVDDESKKKKICYCRVSSSKQKEDLERQIKYMKEKFPMHEIIKDIGSGLNMNREGLKKIIDMGINGEIEELVIAYKDRLARFGYDLIERLIKEYSNGEIKVENNDEEKTPMDELSKDIVAIMNVYVAKMNGLRKYKKLLKEDIKNNKN